ncbi:MAG: hypothetical protein JSS43_09985 [Proteobacteria bacterium]|nr:hypothetical protein [Pseudomonadota bacterium]
MAMKSRAASAFVMFDVIYADGTRSSNRKVPASALGGLEGDEPARGIIEAQDREIAAASGRPRSDVSSITRTPPRPANDPAGPERKPKGKR